MPQERIVRVHLTPDRLTPALLAESVAVVIDVSACYDDDRSRPGRGLRCGLANRGSRGSAANRRLHARGECCWAASAAACRRPGSTWAIRPENTPAAL